MGANLFLLPLEIHQSPGTASLGRTILVLVGEFVDLPAEGAQSRQPAPVPELEEPELFAVIESSPVSSVADTSAASSFSCRVLLCLT